MMIALAVQHGMKINQLDVTSAYLNGVLEKEVFMEKILDLLIRMEGKDGEIGKKTKKMLIDLKKGNKVCLLSKSLYGLR